ncbi:MAG: polysaccharide biosynthesis/export family protein [Planctomycetia bacterium]|nr:polysaccharide biosynthesis/export family protein [Planctomycetia bacterium]
MATITSAGCWAPLTYHGIPANTLPDSFRTPWRTTQPRLNYGSLTIPGQGDYIIGPNDVLGININELYPNGEAVRAQVMENGDIHLPITGPLAVGGMNLAQANEAITKAYAKGFLKDSRVNVFLLEKSTVGVVVLGAVQQPGVYQLPKFENDVAHALAAAGGLSEEAGDVIEVHRRITAGPMANAQTPQYEPAINGGPVRPCEILGSARHGELLPGTDANSPPSEPMPAPPLQGDDQVMGGGIVRIPLRGAASEPMTPDSIVLHPGDVVVVPNRAFEAFYVVGRLSTNNTIRFSLAVPERELGNALLLPSNREVDVVTGVAMAGYIDPIESPTTVTVHRMGPDGTPLLIVVDLIRARYDRSETVLIQPGDIIYLNPDLGWWGRRTFDAIIRNIVTIRLTHRF